MSLNSKQTGLIVLAAALGLWVITDRYHGTRPAPAAVAKPKNASLVLACRDFGKLVREAQAETLTQAEARVLARRVRDNLRLSHVPGAEEAGNALLRTLTKASSTAADYGPALALVAAHCKEAE